MVYATASGGGSLPGEHTSDEGHNMTTIEAPRLVHNHHSIEIYRGFQEHLRESGRRLSTRNTYLNLVTRYLRDNPDPWALSTDDVYDWLGGTGWTDDTCRKAVVTLRQLFRWAEMSGTAASVPMLRAFEPHSAGPAPIPAPALWAGPVEAYCGWLGAGGQSPNTIRLRRCQVKLMARSVGVSPWEVSTSQLVEWLRTDRWSAATRSSMREAARGFFEWARVAGLVDASPAVDLPSVRVRVGTPRPTPAVVVLKALESADDLERLAIYFAMYAGLRRMEIAKVHTDDIADGTLHVVGKGGKHRLIPVHPMLHTELEAAIARRSLLGRRYSGWLFPSPRGGHFTAGCIGKRISDQLPEGWTTHTLRHRFASQAYAVHRDLRAVQELLGHSSPEMTARYTAVPDGALAAAVASVGLS